MTRKLSRVSLAVSAASMVLAGLAAPASAQSSYGGDRYGTYDNGAPIGATPDFRAPPRDDLPEPQGYDGTRPPPPPPGYESPDDKDEWSRRDARYAADAERWARENCVKSRAKTGEGALIGGVLGAIIGSALSSGGRHHRGDGGGTVAGLAVGAVAGAAIGSSSGNETSPGCPPGYVVRRNAPVYVYQTDYVYAAPGWYRPWVYSGGYWSYRPYPYHRWYYDRYRAPYRPYPGYGRPHRGPDWRRESYRDGYRDGYRDHHRDRH